MTELRLAKLPDRTPVKLSITVSPELNKALHQYAELYCQTYGAEESVTELVPFMLETFLEGDRRFKAALKQGGAAGRGQAASAGHR